MLPAEQLHKNMNMQVCKSKKIGLPEKVTCVIILNYSDLLHKSIKICEECTEWKYYTEAPEEMEVQ